jgi:hypothetical protein
LSFLHPLKKINTVIAIAMFNVLLVNLFISR